MDFSKHSNGTTSVKVHHAPGGSSSFSLAWDQSAPTKTRPAKSMQVPLQEAKLNPLAGQSSEVQTSVKVRNPPGGRSQIVFG
jgi:hypothetical protein